MVTATGETQLLHNIVVLEEGAEATLITGCGASHGIGKIAHVGATEIYLGRNSRLNYVMIHSWTPNSEVRPRTGIVLGEDARYTEYYLSHGGVGILESKVEAWQSRGASLYTASIVVAEESQYSLDTRVYLEEDKSNAELISRVLGRGGSKVSTKAIIEAWHPDTKGHRECQALQLNNKAYVETIPILRSRTPGAELSHEAAIVKINEDELTYLMARGLDEEQARAILLRGFIHIDVPGMPKGVKKLIEGVERILAERHAL